MTKTKVTYWCKIDRSGYFIINFHKTVIEISPHWSVQFVKRYDYNLNEIKVDEYRTSYHTEKI